MDIIRTLLSAVLLLITVSAAAHKIPTESQCREMVDGMIQSMKKAPIEKEKDKQSAQAVIDRIEKMVQQNRSLGVSECESWANINKIVFTQ